MYVELNIPRSSYNTATYSATAANGVTFATAARPTSRARPLQPPGHTSTFTTNITHRLEPAAPDATTDRYAPSTTPSPSPTGHTTNPQPSTPTTAATAPPPTPPPPHPPHQVPPEHSAPQPTDRAPHPSAQPPPGTRPQGHTPGDARQERRSDNSLWCRPLHRRRIVDVRRRCARPTRYRHACEELGGVVDACNPGTAYRPLSPTRSTHQRPQTLPQMTHLEPDQMQPLAVSVELQHDDNRIRQRTHTQPGTPTDASLLQVDAVCRRLGQHHPTPTVNVRQLRKALRKPFHLDHDPPPRCG